MLFPFIFSALTAGTGALPPASSTVVPLVAVTAALPQAVSDSALTAEEVTKYIALKRALQAYWQDPSHAALLETAKATAQHPGFDAADTHWSRVAVVYDYPALVAKDTALAALFTRAQFPPSAFADVQVAVWRAMMELIANELDSAQYSIPDDVAEDIAVVKTQRKALEAIGIVPYAEVPPGQLPWAAIMVKDDKMMMVNEMQP